MNNGAVSALCCYDYYVGGHHVDGGGKLDRNFLLLFVYIYVDESNFRYVCADVENTVLSATVVTLPIVHAQLPNPR